MLVAKSLISIHMFQPDQVSSLIEAVKCSTNLSKTSGLASVSDAFTKALKVLKYKVEMKRKSREGIFFRTPPSHLINT